MSDKRKSPPRKRRPSAYAYRTGEAAHMVLENLRKRILSGEIAAAAPLSHQALAEYYKTSNGPIISALQQLAAEGLVVYSRGQGCRTSAWDLSAVEDALVVRRGLETESARMAAERINPEGLERLQVLLAKVDADDSPPFADLDVHRELAVVGGSDGLAKILAPHWSFEQLRRRLYADHTEPNVPEAVRRIRSLKSIVSAVGLGDADLAGAQMHAYLSMKLAAVGANGN